MSATTKLLEAKLKQDYFALLPPLTPNNKSSDEVYKKNLSRAYGAFAIEKICKVTSVIAAAAVVDDFEDKGIDVIFYSSANDTLYLVQSKFKDGSQVKQDEVLKFCEGVKKIVDQDFTGFNNQVKNRQNEIENAMDSCSKIALVLAYIGDGLSVNALGSINDFLSTLIEDEERLEPQCITFDLSKAIKELRDEKAYTSINEDLFIDKCTWIDSPKKTYFGLIELRDLIKLHDIYGLGLYNKNIRTFLGNKTDVNASIQKTLDERPNEFVYMNNGVAVLCNSIEAKGKHPASKKKKLRILGLSVINGAQTIASAAEFASRNPGKDISHAKVSITIVLANAAEDFGIRVTQNRNHQNPVYISNFAALDSEQERLRREIAHLNWTYSYKAGVYDGLPNSTRITIEEASQALALFNSDPRFIVWLKREPNRFLRVESDEYKSIFNKDCTPFQLINAVLFYRYIHSKITNEVSAATGHERLTYKHGIYMFGWVLAQRVKHEQSNTKIFSTQNLNSQLSLPADQLRNTLWNETQQIQKGPLALFRNQTEVIPLLVQVILDHYSLQNDNVVLQLRQQQNNSSTYPLRLFDYLISKVPQIRDLT